MKSNLTVEPVEDIRIDLVLVELVEHLVASILVKLELHVLAADLQEAVVDLLDALAVVADRIAVAGHEVDRGGLVHLIEIFRFPDILQTAHHIMEHAGRCHRAAERVGDVLIHDRLVARQPVEVRAHVVVLLVAAKAAW